LLTGFGASALKRVVRRGISFATIIVGTLAIAYLPIQCSGHLRTRGEIEHDALAEPRRDWFAKLRAKTNVSRCSEACGVFHYDPTGEAISG
jgi:hypothetical protein